MSLLCRLKNLVHKGLLKQEDLDRIIIIPKGQENKVVKMREATPEERASIAKYINNMSKLTGVSFENLEQGSCDDTVPFDFELYQAGLMDMPKEMIEVLDKIKSEIIDTRAYEQEVNEKTEFLKGINYCLSVIDKFEQYKVESEK